MIRECGSEDLQVDQVAERAGVNALTVASYFDSRSQLIAEAQMANYFAMVEPLHLVMSQVEMAMVDRDEERFWSAVKKNMDMAWSSGQFGDRWGIIKLLLDAWSDPFTRRHFSELLDIQFSRWVEVIEGAQRLGWVDPSIDAKALTAVFWSASVGQVITADSAFLNPSPESVRDFYLKVVRGATLEPTRLPVDTN